MNSELPRPLQELQVHQRGVSLADKPQYVVVKTLDPGLNPAYACVCKKPDVLTLEIGLYLIEEGVLGFGCRQSRQNGLEIRHVEDVVDKLKAPGSIAAGELGQFGENTLRRFRPVLHPGSIQTTEGAM